MTRVHRSAAAMPPAGRSWATQLRRVHVLTSLPLALVLLFYAITGFVANRADLFQGEAGQAPAARRLPEGLPITREALAPFLAGMLPAGAELAAWQDGTAPQAEFRLDDCGWRLRIDPQARTVRSLAIGAIPTGIALAPEDLAAWLHGRLSGHADPAKAEDDAESCSLDLASVWGTHHVIVDKGTRTWTATTIRPQLVVSLVDLHRGKHAGAWQRLIVDAAALVLALVTVTGAAMGLLAAAPARRRLTLLLLFAAVGLLVLLLVGR